MKKNIILLSLIILFAGCKTADVNDSTKTSNGTPKLISETNGWHVLGGQRIPLSVGEIPMYLQYENGHLTQFYYGSFYANTQNTTYDYVRCNMHGDSLYCKQSGTEYLPFFYKEGDATDARYGILWQSSPRSVVNLSGIGSGVDDKKTPLYTFSSSKFCFKFSNPNLFMYYDGLVAGIKAYRIGTGEVINLASNTLNNFSELTYKGALEIDETYCKANPTHIKAYYASNNPGVSYYGHSPNYITIYSVDDVNKTVFRDSTSLYREQAAGANYKISCNDADNVYFFFGNYTLATDMGNDNKNVLMLVYSKSTQKIIKKKLLNTIPYASNAVIIPSKNQIYFTTANNIYKLNLETDEVNNITPTVLSNVHAIFAIATDGSKIYAIVGSADYFDSTGITNVIYYE